jgi:anaerobic ribonucleoside-triphosphate reductase activating protein
MSSSSSLLRYHRIAVSRVDGPGERAVLWTQGCPIHCPGCQNRHLWDPAGGRDGHPFWLAMRLATLNLPVTITGGEPFYQPEALAELLSTLRALRPGVEILVYSGYTLGTLLSTGYTRGPLASVAAMPSTGDAPAIGDALALIDVLVDGPYVAAEDHDALQYRGSANQRALDLPATLAALEPVELDWDTPRLTITREGDVLAAAALLEPYLTLGQLRDHRRCGQVD